MTLWAEPPTPHTLPPPLPKRQQIMLALFPLLSTQTIFLLGCMEFVWEQNQKEKCGKLSKLSFEFHSVPNVSVYLLFWKEMGQDFETRPCQIVFSAKISYKFTVILPSKCSDITSIFKSLEHRNFSLCCINSYFDSIKIFKILLNIGFRFLT